jgi:hypothetical protein
MKCALSSINYMLKLTESQVAEIRERWQAGGVKQSALAAEYGVSQGLVSAIVQGKLHAKPRGQNKSPKGLITDEGRECSRCGVFKLWSEYSPHNRAQLTGHMSACKECRNRDRTTETTLKGYRRKRSPEERRAAARAAHLLWKFGITQEEYDRLLEAQGGVCALCRQPELKRRRQNRWGDCESVNFHIDHDHSCGLHSAKKACKACIRGLLCNNCNWLIGLVEGKPLLESRFSDYLPSRPFADGREVMLMPPYSEPQSHDCGLCGTRVLVSRSVKLFTERLV